MKERIQNGFNPNKNRGRGKQSYMERSFSSWLKETLPNLLYTMEQPFTNKDLGNTYFVDFYFPSLNLVIELDGSQHEYTKQHDDDRDRYLSATYSVRIVRITHVEYQSKARVEEILSILSESN